jgi:hypothetical protein
MTDISELIRSKNNYWKDARMALLMSRLELYQLEPCELHGSLNVLHLSWVFLYPYQYLSLRWGSFTRWEQRRHHCHILHFYYQRSTILLNLVLIFEITEKVYGPVVVFCHLSDLVILGRGLKYCKSQWITTQ